MRHLLPSLFEEVNNVMSGCCAPRSSASGLSISEDEKKFYIDAAVPGATTEDIEVTFDREKRRLKIAAKSKLKRENVNYHLKSGSDYLYEIALPTAIDSEQAIAALCKDGMLSIEVSKMRSLDPLKVEVKVA